MTGILICRTGGGPALAVEIVTDLDWPPPDTIPADGGRWVLTAAVPAPPGAAGVLPCGHYGWVPDGAP